MKTILVTGCLGGIGSSTTKELIKNGYKVVGFDIKENSDIEGLDYYKVNIRDEESIKNAFNEIKSKYDELYAIIHLSGIYIMDSLLEISDEELERIFDINFKGIARINRIFFPMLKKGSRILMTSSELAPLDPLPFNGIYSIVKSTVEKYAFSLRMELNIFGIRVSLLRPGAIKTDMIGESMSSLEKFVSKTEIHKNSSLKFKKIVDSVESKTIEPSKLAMFINKIISKKKPKYVYTKNANFKLKLLNALPDKWQVKIVSKLIK